MLRHLLALTLASSLVLVPLGGAANADSVPGATGGPVPQSTEGHASPAAAASAALHQARALFDRVPTGAERRLTGRRSTVPRDGTLVLRELALRLNDLPTADERAEARRMLLRPTDASTEVGGEPKYTVPASVACTATVCVHWVENDTNAPTGSDGDPNTVPAWVSTTLATVDSVYATETGTLGYRPPVSDLTAADNGGDGRLDVYLANIGDQGVYGYCAPEDPNRANTHTVYGYCVLDNDYAPAEFGAEHTPLENLEVTAAHELFHAVQFAYDWSEDLWLMEGTATWIEDQLYDAIDDNRRYLAVSPLAASDMPLDFASSDWPGYGAWVFWRFFSEWIRPGSPTAPDVIRQVWENAAGPEYSTSALARVLAAHHRSLPVALERFGMWNRDPRHFYTEGSAYSSPPLLRSETLTRSRRHTPTRSARLYHLGQLFVRYTPGSSLQGHWRLRVSVDMPATYRGSRAQIVVHRRNGAITPYPVRLSRTGAGSRVVGFDRRSIRYVELDLVDASARFHCGRNTYLTCAGVPLDDGLRSTFRARAVR